MKHLVIFILLLITSAHTKAQSDPEYRMEFGVGIGTMGYIGDFNNSPFKSLKPMGSIIFRYVLNPYMGMRVNASYGKIKGTSKGVKSYYPNFTLQPYEFNNTMIGLDVGYEYNFWPYGTGRDYRGAKPITPFVTVGLGANYVKLNSGSTIFSANLPLGGGVKYKINERLNLGLEWLMHFSFSDKLDGQKDPYGIQSSGLFKNTDCYSTLKLTLTYSFMAKCITCHNEDE